MSLVDYSAVTVSRGKASLVELNAGNVFLLAEDLQNTIFHHPSGAAQTVTLPSTSDIVEELQMALSDAHTFCLRNTGSGTSTLVPGDSNTVFGTGSAAQAVVAAGCSASFTITCSSFDPPEITIETFAGSAGSAGAAGKNAYTTVGGAGFTTVGFGTPLAVVLTNTSWMAAGQIVYIQGAGHYSVNSIGSSTVATITNLGYPGNQGAGIAIPANNLVTAGGLQGPAGTNGTSGTNGTNAYTVVGGAGFTTVGFGSPLAVVLNNTSWMAVGQIIYIQGAGYYYVTAIGGPTVATITNLGYPGNQGAGIAIPPNNLVTAGGLQGPNGQFLTTFVPFAQPAVGATQNVSISDSGLPGAFWPGVNVAISNTNTNLVNYYTCTAHVSNSSVYTLKNLGYSSTLVDAPGVLIPSGSPVWVVGPVVKAVAALNTPVNTGTLTALGFTNTAYDSAAGWNTGGSGTNKYKIPYAGHYKFTLQLNFTNTHASSTFTALGRITNGATVLSYGSCAIPPNSAVAGITITAGAVCAANDLISFVYNVGDVAVTLNTDVSGQASVEFLY